MHMNIIWLNKNVIKTEILWYYNIVENSNFKNGSDGSLEKTQINVIILRALKSHNLVKAEKQFWSTRTILRRIHSYFMCHVVQDVVPMVTTGNHIGLKVEL